MLVKSLFCFALLLAVLSVGACGADPPLVDETDAVVSVRDKGRDYTALKTFVMPDTLDEFCVQSPTDVTTPDGNGGASGVTCINVDHNNDTALLNEIADNMKDVGYQEIDSSDAASADMVIVAGIVTRNLWNISLKFCVDQPLIEGCIKALTDNEILVPAGSLVFVVVDQKASEDQNLKAAWYVSVDRHWASGYGLGRPELGEGGAGNTTGLAPWLSGIEQAFEQSPYFSSSASEAK